MTTATLTEVEARVLWTALNKSWAPMVGYAEYRAAIDKLCVLGRGYCCRDCTALGTHSSHYGGFVCAEHKANEDHRFALEDDRAWSDRRQNK